VVLTKREETTRKSIIDQFRNFLATDVREGDTIYFHYSGHGYQAPDTDPDKDPSLKIQAPKNPLIGNSPSGLDQTILPTDDPDRNANQIRNDELGLLVKQVFDAAHGKRINVLVTIDACHSGGGTRGIARIVRGKPYEGQPPKSVVSYDPSSPDAVFLNKVRGYTFLSACRPDQEAGEAVGPDRRTYGRFTLALCNALADCSPSTNYRQLYDQIDETMASRWTFGAVDAFSQNPQLEGEANRTVFGATAQPSPSYMTLLPTGKNSYRLKGGALQGVTEGSVLKLFASSDLQHPLATLTTTKVGIVDSSFESTPPLAKIPASKLVGARAMLTSQGASSREARIDLSAIKASPLFGQIKSTILDRVPSAQVDEQPDPEAVLKVDASSPDAPGSVPGFRIFRTLNGAEVTADASGKSEPITDTVPESIADRIFNELRYTAISQMTNEFPGQRESVEIQAVPCQIADDGSKAWARDLPTSESAWKVDSHFTLKVRVIGNWEPYIAILDLTSDGSVGVLWPDKERSRDSVQIRRPLVHGKPDSSWQRLRFLNTDQFAVFDVTVPLGGEIIKVVASERPLPFQDLLSSVRGAISNLSPLGRVFQHFSTVTTRSQDESTDPGEIWSTRQIFRIVRSDK